MPATAEMTTTAYIYRGNSGWLAKSLEPMSDEEWKRRPSETSNPVVWIVGHLIWTRSRGLNLMGVEWSRPWLKLFARGAELVDSDQYPSPRNSRRIGRISTRATWLRSKGCRPRRLPLPCPIRRRASMGPWEACSPSSLSMKARTWASSCTCLAGSGTTESTARTGNREQFTAYCRPSPFGLNSPSRPGLVRVWGMQCIRCSKGASYERVTCSRSITT